MQLGIDVGSVTVKVVLFEDPTDLIHDYYVRSHGEPINTVISLLDDLFDRVRPEEITAIGTAGSGGELFSRLLGGVHTNEIVSQAEAASYYYPETRTVIELGGQDSKLLILGHERGKVELLDFALNNQCSAGTGSFLDQQARRLGYSIEEFSRLALESSEPPRIAGRCSVFAKSDIIHLQQIGTSDPDIINGLCYAVARNFVSDIGRGKTFRKPIVFQGGVSKNAGMVRAFTDVLDLDEGELLIPEHPVLMTAIGTGLRAADDTSNPEFDWAEKRRILNDYAEREQEFSTRKSLSENSTGPSDSGNSTLNLAKNMSSGNGGPPRQVYLGIDVGSISTNLVAIEGDNQLLGRVYLQTAGDPISAVQSGLSELHSSLPRATSVQGLGVTGSGREMIANLVGADLVKNEITSQATAAMRLDSQVDTIFEIGGQDSKFIRLEADTVRNFRMNKACAAGTGSFLEEQAKRLDISVDDFGKLAFKAKNPVDLGERCTVFMESDLVHYQQRGASKENLIAGLAYSVAINYLNRVVGDNGVGNRISFQGGVAGNDAVVAAFRELLEERTIFVPPHHDVLGAYGAALLVKGEMASSGPTGKSSFVGFDFIDRDVKSTSFVCKGCSNRCKIQKIELEEGPTLYYGGRCGKYDQNQESRRGPSGEKQLTEEGEMEDLFEFRASQLWEGRGVKGEESQPTIYPQFGSTETGKIGIPRVLLFWNKFPFWSHFFRSLGYAVVLSGPTDKEKVKSSVQNATAETCLPAKIAHGHIKSLIEYASREGLDYLFLPSMVSNDHPNTQSRTNYNCPLIQGLPYISNGQFEFDRRSYPFQVISSPFHFYREGLLEKELSQLGKELGAARKALHQSWDSAKEAQQRFVSDRVKKGKAVLEKLRGSGLGLVIISRAYNGCDPGLNMAIPDKLRKQGVTPIPMDFLPLQEVNPDEIHPFMQWDWGKRILSATALVKEHPNLFPVYLSHFRCGPDSFLLHYVKEMLEGEPLLELELDEHSADAGIITRCEAYVDSLKLSRNRS